MTDQDLAGADVKQFLKLIARFDAEERAAMQRVLTALKRHGDGDEIVVVTRYPPH
jgi:hypothetical protein